MILIFRYTQKFALYTRTLWVSKVNFMVYLKSPQIIFYQKGAISILAHVMIQKHLCCWSHDCHQIISTLIGDSSPKSSLCTFHTPHHFNPRQREGIFLARAIISNKFLRGPICKKVFRFPNFFFFFRGGLGWGGMLPFLLLITWNWIGIKYKLAPRIFFSFNILWKWEQQESYIYGNFLMFPNPPHLGLKKHLRIYL